MNGHVKCNPLNMLRVTPLGVPSHGQVLVRPKANHSRQEDRTLP